MFCPSYLPDFARLRLKNRGKSLEWVVSFLTQSYKEIRGLDFAFSEIFWNFRFPFGELHDPHLTSLGLEPFHMKSEGSGRWEGGPDCILLRVGDV